MIKVITDKRPRFNAVCPSCTSELEYMNEDIQVKKTGQSRQRYSIKFCGDIFEQQVIKYIICPVCGEIIIVDKKWLLD